MTDQLMFSFPVQDMVIYMVGEDCFRRMVRWLNNNHPDWYKGAVNDFFPEGVSAYSKIYHRIRPDQVSAQVEALLAEGAPLPKAILIQCGDRELVQLQGRDVTPLKEDLESMAKQILRLFHNQPDPPRLFYIGLSPKSSYNVPRDIEGTNRMDEIHSNRIKLMEDGLQDLTILKPYLFKSNMRQFFVEPDDDIASESELGAQAWARTILRDVGKRYDWHRGPVVKEVFINDFIKFGKNRGPRGNRENRRPHHAGRQHHSRGGHFNRRSNRDQRDSRVSRDNVDRDPLNDLSRDDLQKLLRATLNKGKQH